MPSFASSDGEEIFVAIEGEGPPVVLLHEWTADHRVFGPIARDLARRFTVYRWDARGHGQSRCAGGTHTVAQMGLDLLALTERFGLEAPVVVGHSMGALTLWQAVAQRGAGWLGGACFIDQSPCLVNRPGWELGIYGTFSRADADALTATLEADFPGGVLELIGGGRNAKARGLYLSGAPVFDGLRRRLEQMDHGPLTECWRSLIEADFRPALAQVTVPTLLIHGGESNYYVPGTGPYLLEAMPGAVTLLVYDGADHSPHVGAPERFVRDLTAFIGAAVDP